MQATVEIIRRGEILKYSGLALPLAFCGMPLYIYAPDFYASTGQLSLGAIALILLGIRLFDAVQDPWIGVFSDRFASKLPTMMMCGMLGLVAAFWLLFHPPYGAGAWWFGMCMLAATTAFSVVTINFQSLGAVWSDNAHQKNRISAYREAIGLLGLLFAAAIPSLLKNSMSSADAFHVTSLIFAILMLLCGWFFLHLIRSGSMKLRRSNADRFRFSNLRHYWRFYLIYALSMLASSIPAVLVLFFIRDYLAAEHLSGLFLVIYFLAGALGMPLWLQLAKRVGSGKAWALSMVVALGSFAFAYGLAPGDVVAYAIICALSGLALGAELALPPAWLAAQIEAGSRTSHASSYFAMLTFFGKAMLAIASGVFLLALDASNFMPGVENHESATSLLLVSYTLIPCGIKLMAALLLWHFIRQQPTKGNTNETIFHRNDIRSSHHG